VLPSGSGEVRPGSSSFPRMDLIAYLRQRPGLQELLGFGAISLRAR
jgi:hypothetical protein